MSGTFHVPAQPIPRWMIALLLALAALRLPAFVAPIGSDQSLYLYISQRVLAGGVPYVDAWDQKPPAVYAIYAALWTVWPHASVIALADLLAAVATAWLLIAIGRRAFGARTGAWAAAIFLLGSHPALTRLDGVYVRGQCEVFISLAVAAALLPLAHARRTVWRALIAGLWLGVAIWLKFNAAAYVLPIAAAAWYWSDRDLRAWLRDLLVVAMGVVFVSAVVLTYFAAHNALEPLKLATVDYNIAYSSAAFTGTAGPLAYLMRLPIHRASVDLLWFLGGAGAVVVLFAGALGRRTPRGSAAVALAWIAAALIAITINARDLPQYFVQAAPALALAAAIGGTLVISHPIGRWLAMAVLAAGLWRVGVSDRPVRFGELPDLAANVAFDLDYARGRISRGDYLARFRGAQKYDASEIDALTVLVRSTTAETDRILVFGFSPGAYVFSGRQSASRFFWSYPVVIEFAADQRGYGAAGLLHDLQQHPPALVALQKQDYGPADPNSYDFFFANTALRLWLQASYTRESESPMFSVWRRKP